MISQIKPLNKVGKLNDDITFYDERLRKKAYF